MQFYAVCFDAALHAKNVLGCSLSNDVPSHALFIVFNLGMENGGAPRTVGLLIINTRISMKIDEKIEPSVGDAYL